VGNSDSLLSRWRAGVDDFHDGLPPSGNNRKRTFLWSSHCKMRLHAELFDAPFAFCASNKSDMMMEGGNESPLLVTRRVYRIALWRVLRVPGVKKGSDGNEPEVISCAFFWQGHDHVAMTETPTRLVRNPHSACSACVQCGWDHLADFEFDSYR